MSLKFGTSGIRGLNTEFTSSTVRAYISAFIQYAEAKTSVEKIAIGGDLRESTPGIHRMVEDILISLGCIPIDCGKLPTPALALYCMEKKVPGIMITGSHIPADRNGIKFYWPWGEILKEDELEIVNRFEIIYSKISKEFIVEHQEEVEATNLYIKRYTHFFSPYREKFNGKKIIVYQHSAVARDVWKPILSNLGFEVLEVGRTSIFTPVDTETNEAVKALEKLLKPLNISDFFAIVSSDGDADRPFLCDENLIMVRGDSIGILSSEFLNADYIVTPVSTNTALEKAKISDNIIRTKIGSPFVIEGMSRIAAELKNSVSINDQAKEIVGFEANGGLLLGTDISKNGLSLTQLPTRDSILPILCCLALASEKSLSLSQLVATLPSRYTDSDLLREFPIEKKNEIYKEAIVGESFKRKFIAKYGEIADQNEVDGLRLTFANGDIIHFRPSGNAPEFRCYAEAATPLLAKTLVSEGISWLSSFTNSRSYV